MIRVTPYTKAFEEDLRKWLRLRSLGDSGVNELPGIGFVAIYYCDSIATPVAAGFLRRCEGGYGMMDSFVTDPSANSHIRNEALDNIVESLMEISRSKEIRNLLFTTLDVNTKSRGERFGFKSLPHALMALKVE